MVLLPLERVSLEIMVITLWMRYLHWSGEWRRRTLGVCCIRSVWPFIESAIWAISPKQSRCLIQDTIVSEFRNTKFVTYRSLSRSRSPFRLIGSLSSPSLIEKCRRNNYDVVSNDRCIVRMGLIADRPNANNNKIQVFVG